VAVHLIRAPAISTTGLALMPDQKRRVADLVASNYGSKLTLERPAGEIDLSPFHFGCPALPAASHT
jgi:hypothetical protein